MISPIHNRSLERTSVVIVHEIVHQWTGVKLLNDWWSGFWMNEGLTRWLQYEIIAKLVDSGQIPESESSQGYADELASYSKQRDLFLEKGDVMAEMGESMLLLS